MADQKQAHDYEKEDQETTLANGSQWTKRVVLDIPIWALKKIDKESNRRAIARQDLIKTWLIDRIDAVYAKESDVKKF
ncbi:MAG: CopG family transcriptional regulator [Bdellovibrionota bacterium]